MEKEIDIKITIVERNLISKFNYLSSIGQEEDEGLNIEFIFKAS